jgi:hypothetical protein
VLAAAALPRAVKQGSARADALNKYIAGKQLTVNSPAGAVLSFSNSAATNVSSLADGFRPFFVPARSETVEYFTLTSSYSYSLHEQVSDANTGDVAYIAAGSGYFFSYAQNTYIDSFNVDTLAQNGTASRDVTLTGILGPGLYIIATLGESDSLVPGVAGDSGTGFGSATQTLTLTAVPTPEPGSLTLLGIGGALSMTWLRRRKLAPFFVGLCSKRAEPRN